MSEQRPPFTNKVWQSVFLLLGIAFAGRIIYSLLEPALPVIVALAVVGAIFWFMFRRR